VSSISKGRILRASRALQLAMSIEERFGVRIPEGDEARPIFRSVASLAEFVAKTKAAAP
jgi:acyl carrier protein